jgi:hypothetical protein
MYKVLNSIIWKQVTQLKTEKGPEQKFHERRHTGLEVCFKQ